MITHPQFYNGVALMFSGPNRYDRENGYLCAGPPGRFLFSILNDCGVNPAECYITDQSSVPPGTEKIITFGQRMGALQAPPHIQDWNLFNHRGYVGFNGQWTVVGTFSPVDCVDIKDYEDADYSDDEDDNAGSTNKDAGDTARANYRFWSIADIRKILVGERLDAPGGGITRTCHDVVGWLEAQTGQELFFDIESHPLTNTIQCFAIANKTSPIISVPVYDYNKRACGNLPRLFAALARALQRNRVVIHNAAFDLAFLAHFHGVPFGQDVFDTMLAHHRCFPEAEKSLAHVISYWINAPFHKDSAGTFNPKNQVQLDKLLHYNAQDVKTLRAVYYSMRAHIDARPGLAASVAQANASLPRYIEATLRGLRVNEQLVRAKKAALNTSIEQHIRVIRVLIGSPDFLPSSNDHVAQWLYDGLKYPVLDRTETGKPSTDARTLYRLIHKNPNNVALKVLMKLKEEQKVLSMLGFTPYFRPEKRTC